MFLKQICWSFVGNESHRSVQSSTHKQVCQFLLKLCFAWSCPVSRSCHNAVCFGDRGDHKRTLFLLKRTDMLYIITAAYIYNHNTYTHKNHWPNGRMHHVIAPFSFFTAGYFWLLGIDLSWARLPLLVRGMFFCLTPEASPMKPWWDLATSRLPKGLCWLLFHFKREVSQVKYCRTSDYVVWWFGTWTCCNIFRYAVLSSEIAVLWSGFFGWSEGLQKN